MWGNGSRAEPWAAPPCDERLCSALPLRALVPVTAVCLGLFAVGVVGNVLTVLVTCGHRDARSTTDLYLGSMAVSDLLILLGLPLDLYRLWRSRPWIFGQLLCRLSHYLSEGCTYCTILHVTALTVERYLAVCFPLRAKVLVTRRRVRAVIGALWAFALLSAAPFFFLVGVVQPDNRTDFSRECKPTPRALESGLLGAMFWVTTSYFVLPVVCLSVLYGFIGRELWRSRGRLRGPGAALRERGHRQTVRILGESPAPRLRPCGSSRSRGPAGPSRSGLPSDPRAASRPPANWLLRGRLSGDLIGVYKRPEGGEVDEAGLFLVVCSNWARSNGLERRELCADMWKNFLTVRTTALDLAAQRGCGVSFCGDTPGPSGRPPV
uniref:Motilin receptor n=1 Tax=Phasianus colchicus TaxID=9054 RepID=A0A669QP62_PHACC